MKGQICPLCKEKKNKTKLAHKNVGRLEEKRLGAAVGGLGGGVGEHQREEWGKKKPGRTQGRGKTKVPGVSGGEKKYQRANDK